MAPRSQPEPPKQATLTKEQMLQGIERLRKRLRSVVDFDPQIVDRQYGCAPVERLEAAIDDGLVRTFGQDTVEYRRYSPAASIDTGPISIARETPLSKIVAAVAASKSRSIALLEQAIESLEEQLSEGGGANHGAATGIGITPSTKVFIVHGHSSEAREAVARFVQKLGLQPVILHEQTNQGRTLIEKFEDHGDVGFAIVLLTADDQGGAVGGTVSPRARQNVILELGYFIGRLGRERVCALKRDDIELPSDFVGVVYQNFDDAGAWKVSLARELEGAGYNVDWNKAMRP